MLLEFTASNYKSFKEQFVFSLTPAPKQRALSYSLLEEAVGGKKYKALSSSVLYGPNAAGKTNIIGAMDTFKQIILRGNIDDVVPSQTPNVAAYTLPLIPNRAYVDAMPVSFSIKFTDSIFDRAKKNQKNLLVEYFVELDLGSFMKFKYPRKILNEHLEINSQLVFKRSDDLNFGNLNLISSYLVKSFSENKASLLETARNNLKETEFFLNNGFKSMISDSIASFILEWLRNKFTIIYRANSAVYKTNMKNEKSNDLFLDLLNKAANIFGVHSNQLEYKRIDDEHEKGLDLYSSLGNFSIPADVYESYGTLRFLSLFPAVLAALVFGHTLIIDEFDASIHPMAIMNIINIFHNDEINKNRAQLVFNTHNPIFLNRNLLRRDEIHFVERDEHTESSVLYRLSDFKTAGKSGVRSSNDYLKNYFISKYGAINDIDFAPVFRDLWSTEDESSEDKSDA